jgi:hypothetical protein
MARPQCEGLTHALPFEVPIAAAPSITHTAMPMPQVKQELLFSHCYCNHRELLLDARDLKYLFNHPPPATPSPPSKKRVCVRRRRFVLLGVFVLLLLLFIALLQIFMPARPGPDTVHLFSPPSSSSSSVSRASKFWNCLPQFFSTWCQFLFSVVLSDLQIGV